MLKAVIFDLDGVLLDSEPPQCRTGNENVIAGDQLTHDFQSMLHERVDQARKGINPFAICKLRSGWVVLGDEQRLPGYTLLLADPIVPSMSDLNDNERAIFLSDMVRIGDALLHSCDPTPIRINYEIMGNKVPWLHANITPRYSWEAEDMRKCPPFVYRGTSTNPFNAERDKGLMQRLCMFLSEYKIG